MMKVIISEEQLKFIIKEEMSDLYLNKPVDFNKISNIEDIKTATKTIGLSTGYGSKSRGNAKNLKPILDLIDSIEDRDIFEEYFLLILELIKKYKKKNYTLKKFINIIAQIVNLDINVAKDQIKKVIDIFQDSRFDDSYKEKLINNLLNQNLTLEDFFEATKKAYQEYENSFSKSELSPFKTFRTSPKIKVTMTKGYGGFYVNIDPKEFDSQGTDLGKMLYIINSLKSFKSYNKNLNMDDEISKIISELKFTVKFDYSPTNIKADLQLKEPLFYRDDVTSRSLPLAKSNSFIEVKYKPYNEPSYLSEFFKVDATTENMSILLEETYKIPNIEDPKKTLRNIISKIVEKLYESVKGGEGEKIINHLTENLSGMIFKNEKFIKKDNLEFYWNMIGYANKPRLSIWYKVKDSNEVFNLSKMDSEKGVKSYTRFVYK